LPDSIDEGARASGRTQYCLWSFQRAAWQFLLQLKGLASSALVEGNAPVAVGGAAVGAQVSLGMEGGGVAILMLGCDMACEGRLLIEGFSM